MEKKGRDALLGEMSEEELVLDLVQRGKIGAEGQH